MTIPVTADPQQTRALEWFKKRVPMLEGEFKALEAKSRRKAFSVAGVAQLDMVHEIQTSLEAAIKNGTSLSEWKAQVSERMTRAWAGTVQRPGFRLETIYRTNMQVAYSAGRYAAMTTPAVLEVRPIWVFDAVLDIRTTDGCKRLNGIARRWDDSFWDTNYPPRHHRCRSGVRAIRSSSEETEIPKNLKTDDGFGLRPDAEEWQPDPTKYIPELQTSFIRKFTDQPAKPIKPAALVRLEQAQKLAESEGHQCIINARVFEELQEPSATGMYWFNTIWLNPKHPNWLNPKQVMSLARGQNLFSTDNEQHLIWHEIGHAVHAANDLTKYRLSRRNRFSGKTAELVYAEVGSYALENNAEFVAEVYTGIRAGQKYSKKILELYFALGGLNP